MTRFVTAILLLSLSMLVAAESPWPKKGDTVFISASFKGIQHPKLVSGAAMTYDMPPCKQLTVTKADPKKLVWVVTDPLANREGLEGEWSPWMFKTEEECKSHNATRGEPRIMKSGTTYKIAPGESGASTNQRTAVQVSTAS